VLVFNGYVHVSVDAVVARARDHVPDARDQVRQVGERYKSR